MEDFEPEKVTNKDSQPQSESQNLLSKSRSKQTADLNDDDLESQSESQNLSSKNRSKQTADLNDDDLESESQNLATRSKQQTDADLSDDDFETKNFRRFVIRKLTALEIKMSIIQKDQKFCLQRQPISNLDLEENQIDIFQNLPLKNEDELEAVEIKLNNDLIYRKLMIKQLARIVCHQDSKTSCIRLMRQIFSNELAMKYSWYGAKKKNIFSNLQLCKVIMCVIRNSNANATDDQISAPIKIWLAHAKERAAKEATKEAAKEAAENIE